MKNSRVSFLRSPRIRMFSRIFIFTGDILLHIFPFMPLNLKQSGIDKEYAISPREYLAVCFFMGAMYAVGGSAVITLLLSMGDQKFMMYGPIIGTVMGFLTFIQLVSYPKMLVNKRVKDLEKNILFALRTILVQVRSGVPIFDSFVSIATGNYGQISEEFRLVVEKGRSGTSVVDTLEELAVRNPSIYFRRAIWQLVNAMKSGSDIGENLKCVIDALAKEQMVQIREYKSVLNPLAMMYMMIAVIMPSLGTTVVIIIKNMPGMNLPITKMTFWMLLGFVVVMQFFFMSTIKAKRPNLL